MNIRQHILIAINDRLPAQRIVRDGVPGVLFTGPDEPAAGEFIPFAHLGVNQIYGYFDMRALAGVASDCTNENTESLHVVLTGQDDFDRGEDRRMYVWSQAESGIDVMLGEVWQVADLYQALRAFVERGETGEPLDEEEVVTGLFADWLQAADAAYVASRANPERFPDPEDAQLQNSIRVAGAAGRIRTRQGESGRTYYKRTAVEEWAARDETRGRPRKEQAAEPMIAKTWRDDPATEKQIARLQSYGIDAAGWTKGQASDEIERHKNADMVTCWECGCSVPRSKAEWNGNGWYCGC
jgi:hypothetical protein